MFLSQRGLKKDEPTKNRSFLLKAGKRGGETQQNDTLPGSLTAKAPETWPGPERKLIISNH